MEKEKNNIPADKVESYFMPMHYVPVLVLNYHDSVDPVAEALAYSAAEGGENIQYTRHNKAEVHLAYIAEKHEKVRVAHPEVKDVSVYLLQQKAAETHEGTLDEYLEKCQRTRVNRYKQLNADILFQMLRGENTY